MTGRVPWESEERMKMIKPKVAESCAIASLGGYGCMYYSGSGKYEPSIPDRHICAIQALTDTTITSIGAAWDAPADNVSDLDISEETTLYVKAASVTIASGDGILYYGYGEAVEAGDGA